MRAVLHAVVIVIFATVTAVYFGIPESVIYHMNRMIAGA
jgi:hypothetical protein